MCSGKKRAWKLIKYCCSIYCEALYLHECISWALWTCLTHVLDIICTRYKHCVAFELHWNNYTAYLNAPDNVCMLIYTKLSYMYLVFSHFCSTDSLVYSTLSIITEQLYKFSAICCFQFSESQSDVNWLFHFHVNKITTPTRLIIRWWSRSYHTSRQKQPSCKKGAALFKMPSIKKLPRNGCDGRLMAQILIAIIQVNLCCLLPASLGLGTKLTCY